MDEIRILLVDDEKDFISTLSERLEMRDITNKTAFDGEEALKFIDIHEPDVIVLDLKMPGIDGMEVLRRVRSAFPRVQVIIHTGHGNDMDELESRRLGIFDYLRKPVPIETMIERIKAAYKAKGIIEAT